MQRARTLEPSDKSLPEEVVSIVHTGTAPVLLPFVALEPSSHVCKSISSEVQARAVVMNRRMLSRGGRGREREREEDNSEWELQLSCLRQSAGYLTSQSKECPNLFSFTMSFYDDGDRVQYVQNVAKLRQSRIRRPLSIITSSNEMEL